MLFFLAFCRVFFFFFCKNENPFWISFGEQKQVLVQIFCKTEMQ